MTVPSWIDATQEAQYAGRPLEVITDNNMLTEFRFGKTSW